MTAELSEIFYHPDEGFEEDNTWHVAEASISADSNVKLADGEATIRHGNSEFAVNIRVLNTEVSSDEENEETENREPAYSIEIEHDEGSHKLALALGLLEK